VVTILKLGGSVVTDKTRAETLDPEALATASDAIAAHLDERAQSSLVVVHGGGSFGHHHAERRGVSSTEGIGDAAGILAVHDAMRRLDDAVLERFHDRDVQALPVHPLSAASKGPDGSLSLPTEQVATMLEEGFVPVLHGDVVAHAGEGATVLSGDDIVVALARGLDADRVGLCSNVPGVLDSEGAVVDRIERHADVAGALDESDETDVTGGMAGKVRTLLALETPASIFELGSLAPFLAGDTPGTTID